MDELRLPAALERCQRILVAGAGGGFDVYAGLPIYARLRGLGKDVVLANLSFTYLGGTNSRQITPGLYLVEPETSGEDGYFPERTLARFLANRGDRVSIYAFEKLGVVQVREGYAHLVRSLGLDAIVLVDGGTDLLLRGDEQNLGTPEEDMTSLAAVASVDVPTRIVACVGFGVDTFHGVCHANWLENVAGLTAEGAFLGATALLERMPEVRMWQQAVHQSAHVPPLGVRPADRGATEPVPRPACRNGEHLGRPARDRALSRQCAVPGARADTALSAYWIGVTGFRAFQLTDRSLTSCAEASATW